MQPMRGLPILAVKFAGGVAGIGSGLALGREGPTIQMGGVLGHAVSKWFGCTARERQTLIAAGASTTWPNSSTPAIPAKTAGRRARSIGAGPWRFLAPGPAGCSLGATRESVEAAWQAPANNAGAASVYSQSSQSPYEMVLVRYTGGKGSRIAAVHRAATTAEPAAERARKLVGSLTGREVEVLTGLGEGRSNAQIAARLYLSEATVKGYVSRMLDKLGLDNRTQAGLLAHDAGLAGR